LIDTWTSCSVTVRKSVEFLLRRGNPKKREKRDELLGCSYCVVKRWFPWRWKVLHLRKKAVPKLLQLRQLKVAQEWVGLQEEVFQLHLLDKRNQDLQVQCEEWEDQLLGWCNLSSVDLPFPRFLQGPWPTLHLQVQFLGCALLVHLQVSMLLDLCKLLLLVHLLQECGPW
jgi:hypothetical protein